MTHERCHVDGCETGLQRNENKISQILHQIHSLFISQNLCVSSYLSDGLNERAIFHQELHHFHSVFLAGDV